MKKGYSFCFVQDLNNLKRIDSHIPYQTDDLSELEMANVIAKIKELCKEIACKDEEDCRVKRIECKKWKEGV